MTSLNILQRLHAAMGEVDYVQKERKAGMNYTIVSHDAVTAKVRPILVKHGVVYYPLSVERTQDGNRTQVDMTVRFCNIENTTDYIDVQSCGYGVDSQDKGPGKAMSYCVKYALLKALGLETGDDPDTENVEHIDTAKTKAIADDKRKKAEIAANEIKKAIASSSTPAELQKGFTEAWPTIKALPDDLRTDVTAAKDAQKALLMDEAA